MAIAKPTKDYEPFGGKVKILVFGKSAPGHNFKPKNLFQVVRNLGIKVLYHPDTSTFNTKICGARHFTQKFEASGRTIYSGCLADGVVLTTRGEAVWLRTADCPTIIARHGLSGEVIAAHAGRASLIDEGALQNGQIQRQPESVVGAIYERLVYSEHLIHSGRRTAHHLETYSCCGIGPRQFRHPIDHPEHGQFNEIMNRHIVQHYGADCFLGRDIDIGALDLHRLIHNQFRLCGVPGDNIHHDSIDTAGQTRYFFSRRGGDLTGHNTILVIRRA